MAEAKFRPDEERPQISRDLWLSRSGSKSSRRLTSPFTDYYAD